MCHFVSGQSEWDSVLRLLAMSVESLLLSQIGFKRSWNCACCLTASSLNSVVQFAPEFAVVYSCFGIFIVFLSKCNVNFTSPLEDDFSGEGQLSGSSIFH